MHPSDNGSNTKITGTYKSNGLFIPDRIATPSELSRATTETAPAENTVDISSNFTGEENSGYGVNGAVVKRVNPEWEINPATGKKFYPLPIFKIIPRENKTVIRQINNEWEIDPATGKKFYPLPIFGTFTGEENAVTEEGLNTPLKGYSTPAQQRQNAQPIFTGEENIYTPDTGVPAQTGTGWSLPNLSVDISKTPIVTTGEEHTGYEETPVTQLDYTTLPTSRPAQNAGYDNIADSLADISNLYTAGPEHFANEAKKKETESEGKRLYRYLTDNTYRAQQDLNALRGGGTVAPYSDTYEMTEKEKSFLISLLEKGKTDDALFYYKSMQDVLARRTGQRTAERVMSVKNPFFRGAAATVLGVDEGANRAVNAGEQILSRISGDTSPVARSASEYAYDTVRSQLSGIGATAADLGSSFGYMLPALIASAASSGLGSAVLGLTTAGDTYSRSRREGKGDTESLLYAGAIGALEGGLQYALGGIDALGKNGVSSFIAKNPAAQAALSNIDDAIRLLSKSPQAQNLLKTAAKIGGFALRMNDEGFEEFLQANLEPVVRNLVFKENNEINPLSPDKLYSYFLGAITAGITNLAGNAAESLDNSGKMTYDTIEGAGKTVIDSVPKMRVGQWMSKTEYEQFLKTGEIPRTNVLTKGMDGYIKQANKGDFYVEFDIDPSLLAPKNEALGWSLIKPKNQMYIKLYQNKGLSWPDPIGYNISHVYTK